MYHVSSVLKARLLHKPANELGPLPGLHRTLGGDREGTARLLQSRLSGSVMAFEDLSSLKHSTPYPQDIPRNYGLVKSSFQLLLY